MKKMSDASRLCTALMIACLMLPQSLWAQSSATVGRDGAVDENPNAFAMLGDFVVARPIGLVLTAGGTVLWLASLPFTLMAGNAGDAADTLILGPGEQTFVRCLGCRQSGYTNRDIEQHEQRKAAAAEAEAAQ
ncbi:MAG: hypothetical protein H6985_01740 [Pseudomonadales bacterium]|nr:hypothetical protein [Halioglobus sp.]MCP5128283.1 hypothetical protein [Pseudomonadales bacterium]